jgi:catechol 2,3-dioxygenase-like lactoylglutathione lyase family enzyme
VNWKLEVVVVPVSDVDRAKAFYTDGAGFELDHDVRPGGEMRVVQLTPPGSACSIVIGAGVGTMDPGSLQGLQLVVRDIAAARSELIERGVEVSDVQQMGAPDQDATKFAFFRDPDGNGWALQEIRARD